MDEFEGVCVRARPHDPAEAEAFVHKLSRISPEEHHRVCTLPQHHPDLSTNEEWLAARKYRFTGSTAGAACHQNPYCSAEQFLFDKIQQTPMDERGKKYCAYGTLHEDDAEAAFGAKLDALKGKTNKKGWTLLDWRAQHLGLYVCKAPGYGMLGMSPDGILHSTWRSPEGGILKIKELIEYKCPATWEKKIGNPHIYKKELVPKLVPGRLREQLLACGKITADGLPLCEGRHKIACPPYYYAQVQYGMALFKMSGIDLPRAHFVVWCPERTSHIKIERDDTFGQWLIQMMVEVYRTKYAPAIVRHIKNIQRKSDNVTNDGGTNDGGTNDGTAEFSGFSLKRKRPSYSRTIGSAATPVDPVAEFSGFSLRRK